MKASLSIKGKVVVMLASMGVLLNVSLADRVERLLHETRNPFGIDGYSNPHRFPHHRKKCRFLGGLTIWSEIANEEEIAPRALRSQTCFLVSQNSLALFLGKKCCYRLVVDFGWNINGD